MKIVLNKSKIQFNDESTKTMVIDTATYKLNNVVTEITLDGTTSFPSMTLYGNTKRREWSINDERNARICPSFNIVGFDESKTYYLEIEYTLSNSIGKDTVAYVKVYIGSGIPTDMIKATDGKATLQAGTYQGDVHTIIPVLSWASGTYITDKDDNTQIATVTTKVKCYHYENAE